jgi:hypothetical protein
MSDKRVCLRLRTERSLLMELLSISRMAKRLGVTKQWLREQAVAGKVPCLAAGKQLLFSPMAVIDALAIQAARPVCRTERVKPLGSRIAALKQTGGKR